MKDQSPSLQRPINEEKHSLLFKRYLQSFWLRPNLSGLCGANVQGTSAAHLLEINDIGLLHTELSDTAITVLAPDGHVHAIAGGLDIQGEGLGLPFDITLEVEDSLSF